MTQLLQPVLILVELQFMPGARLTVEHRRTIERCYRVGLSQEQIASIIGKHKSTVSRELARTCWAAGRSRLTACRSREWLWVIGAATTLSVRISSR